jgi:hypothetical protein
MLLWDFKCGKERNWRVMEVRILYGCVNNKDNSANTSLLTL